MLFLLSPRIKRTFFNSERAVETAGLACLLAYWVRVLRCFYWLCKDAANKSGRSPAAPSSSIFKELSNPPSIALHYSTRKKSFGLGACWLSLSRDRSSLSSLKSCQTRKGEETKTIANGSHAYNPLHCANYLRPVTTENNHNVIFSTIIAITYCDDDGINTTSYINLHNMLQRIRWVSS